MKPGFSKYIRAFLVVAGVVLTTAGFFAARMVPDRKSSSSLVTSYLFVSAKCPCVRNSKTKLIETYTAAQSKGDVKVVSVDDQREMDVNQQRSYFDALQLPFAIDFQFLSDRPNFLKQWQVERAPWLLVLQSSSSKRVDAKALYSGPAVQELGCVIDFLNLEI